MEYLIKLIRPQASVPPIPMGCLAMLFFLPIWIVFLPVTLLTPFGERIRRPPVV